MVVWCLGSHCPAPSLGQSSKSVKPLFCLDSVKWIAMNSNLESKQPPFQLGLGTLDKDQWASYVSTLCQPLRKGKETPNQPAHLDHPHTTPWRPHQWRVGPGPQG